MLFIVSFWVRMNFPQKCVICGVSTGQSFNVTESRLEIASLRDGNSYCLCSRDTFEQESHFGDISISLLASGFLASHSSCSALSRHSFRYFVSHDNIHLGVLAFKSILALQSSRRGSVRTSVELNSCICSCFSRLRYQDHSNLSARHDYCFFEPLLSDLSDNTYGNSVGTNLHRNVPKLAPGTMSHGGGISRIHRGRQRSREPRSSNRTVRGYEYHMKDVADTAGIHVTNRGKGAVLGTSKWGQALNDFKRDVNALAGELNCDNPPRREWINSRESGYKLCQEYVSAVDAGINPSKTVTDNLNGTMRKHHVCAGQTIQFAYHKAKRTKFDHLPVDTPERRREVKNYVTATQPCRQHGMLSLGFTEPFKQELISYILHGQRWPLVCHNAAKEAWHHDEKHLERHHNQLSHDLGWMMRHREELGIGLSRPEETFSVMDEKGFVNLQFVMAHIFKNRSGGHLSYTPLNLIRTLLHGSKPRFTMVLMFNGTVDDFINTSIKTNVNNGWEVFETRNIEIYISMPQGGSVGRGLSVTSIPINKSTWPLFDRWHFEMTGIPGKKCLPTHVLWYSRANRVASEGMIPSAQQDDRNKDREDNTFGVFEPAMIGQAMSPCHPNGDCWAKMMLYEYVHGDSAEVYLSSTGVIGNYSKINTWRLKIFDMNRECYLGQKHVEMEPQFRLMCRMETLRRKEEEKLPSGLVRIIPIGTNKDTDKVELAVECPTRRSSQNDDWLMHQYLSDVKEYTLAYRTDVTDRMAVPAAAKSRAEPKPKPPDPPPKSSGSGLPRVTSKRSTGASSGRQTFTGTSAGGEFFEDADVQELLERKKTDAPDVPTTKTEEAARPPPWNGGDPQQWDTYTQLVNTWLDTTDVDPQRRGAMLVAELSGDAARHMTHFNRDDLHTADGPYNVLGWLAQYFGKHAVSTSSPAGPKRPRTEASADQTLLTGVMADIAATANPQEETISDWDTCTIKTEESYMVLSTDGDPSATRSAELELESLSASAVGEASRLLLSDKINQEMAVKKEPKRTIDAVQDDAEEQAKRLTRAKDESWQKIRQPDLIEDEMRSATSDLSATLGGHSSVFGEGEPAPETKLEPQKTQSSSSTPTATTGLLRPDWLESGLQEKLKKSNKMPRAVKKGRESDHERSTQNQKPTSEKDVTMKTLASENSSMASAANELIDCKATNAASAGSGEAGVDDMSERSLPTSVVSVKTDTTDTGEAPSVHVPAKIEKPLMQRRQTFTGTSLGSVPEPEEENSDDSSVYRWDAVNQETIELFTAQVQSSFQTGGEHRVPTPPLSDDEEFDSDFQEDTATAADQEALWAEKRAIQAKWKRAKWKARWNQGELTPKERKLARVPSNKGKAEYEQHLYIAHAEAFAEAQERRAAMLQPQFKSIIHWFRWHTFMLIRDAARLESPQVVKRRMIDALMSQFSGSPTYTEDEITNLMVILEMLDKEAIEIMLSSTTPDEWMETRRDPRTAQQINFGELVCNNSTTNEMTGTELVKFWRENCRIADEKYRAFDGNMSRTRKDTIQIISDMRVQFTLESYTARIFKRIKRKVSMAPETDKEMIKLAGEQLAQDEVEKTTKFLNQQKTTLLTSVLNHMSQDDTSQEYAVMWLRGKEVMNKLREATTPEAHFRFARDDKRDDRSPVTSPASTLDLQDNESYPPLSSAPARKDRYIRRGQKGKLPATMRALKLAKREGVPPGRDETLRAIRDAIESVAEEETQYLPLIPKLNNEILATNYELTSRNDKVNDKANKREIFDSTLLPLLPEEKRRLHEIEYLTIMLTFLDFEKEYPILTNENLWYKYVLKQKLVTQNKISYYDLITYHLKLGMEAYDEIDLAAIFEDAEEYTDRLLKDNRLDKQRQFMTYQIHRQLHEDLMDRVQGGRYEHASEADQYEYWFQLFVLTRLEMTNLEWWLQHEMMHGRIAKTSGEQGEFERQAVGNTTHFNNYVHRWSWVQSAHNHAVETIEKRLSPWQRQTRLKFMRREVGCSYGDGDFVPPKPTPEYETFFDKFADRTLLTADEIYHSPSDPLTHRGGWAPNRHKSIDQALPDTTGTRNSPLQEEYRLRGCTLETVPWLKLIHCIMVHCHALNEERGEFVLEFNEDDVEYYKKRWGSIHKVREPLRSIAQMKAFLQLWKQEDEMFELICLACQGNTWSSQGDSNIASIKTFDSWLSDYLYSNYGSIRDTQRPSQAYSTVKNPWMKTLLLRFFAKECGIDNCQAKQWINASKAGDHFEVLLGRAVELRLFPWVQAFMELRVQVEGATQEELYRVDLHLMETRGAFAEWTENSERWHNIDTYPGTIYWDTKGWTEVVNAQTLDLEEDPADMEVKVALAYQTYMSKYVPQTFTGTWDQWNCDVSGDVTASRQAVVDLDRMITELNDDEDVEMSEPDVNSLVYALSRTHALEELRDAEVWSPRLETAFIRFVSETSEFQRVINISKKANELIGTRKGRDQQQELLKVEMETRRKEELVKQRNAQWHSDNFSSQAPHWNPSYAEEPTRKMPTQDNCSPTALVAYMDLKDYREEDVLTSVEQFLKGQSAHLVIITNFDVYFTATQTNITQFRDLLKNSDKKRLIFEAGKHVLIMYHKTANKAEVIGTVQSKGVISTSSDISFFEIRLPFRKQIYEWRNGEWVVVNTVMVSYTEGRQALEEKGLHPEDREQWENEVRSGEYQAMTITGMQKFCICAATFDVAGTIEEDRLAHTGVLMESKVISGTEEKLTTEQMEEAKTVIVRRLLMKDLSWLITEILRRQITYLFLKCPEACRYTIDHTPTPGFHGVKNSFDVTQSLLGQLHRLLIDNHNTDKHWELQANHRIMTQCLDNMTRERLASEELFQRLVAADLGFISERPIVAVVYSHNNSHETVQARLTSMHTLQVINDRQIDVNRLTDRQLSDMTLYAFNASEDEMVYSAKGMHESYIQLTPEVKRKKLEAIEALRHNVAMYNISNPDVHQTDVEYIHNDWGPMDYQVKYVSKMWANSQFRRFFANCAQTSEYYQFSGVLGLWVTQIQPTNFRDFVNNTLERPGECPTLRLTEPDNLPQLERSERVIAHSADGMNWEAWERCTDMSASSTSQVGVERNVSLNTETGELIASQDTRVRQTIRWTPNESWDNRDNRYRQRPIANKGKGKSQSSRQEDYRWDRNAWSRGRGGY